MQSALDEVFQRECFSRVQTLQLAKADLPSKFEDALQATNVAVQQAITEQQKQNNIMITSETLIANAII